MGQIADIQNPWRDRLLSIPASFRNVIFHVESGSRSSGQRTVLHEYPKRDIPYAETMGRHARRLQFSGYLIYRPLNPMYEYVSQRDLLVAALEQEDAGQLTHPVLVPNTSLLVMCERYSFTETREKGGYSQFEMSFVEAGSPGNALPIANPIQVLGSSVIGANLAMTSALQNVINSQVLGATSALQNVLNSQVLGATSALRNAINSVRII